MNDITQILAQVEQGDPSAADKLLQLIYDELRRMAAHKLAREKPGQTLQTTDLVHEAYLRLMDHERARHWDSRGHFFAAAAEAMRRILVEQARRKTAARHGGGIARVALDESGIAADEGTIDVVALSEALERLQAEAPRKAALVKLRYFAGMTIAEAAETLKVSHATAERDWTYSRLRLFQWMQGS